MYKLTLTTQSRLLTTLYKTPIENIVGKGENAGNQHFLLLPQCFLPSKRHKSGIKSAKKKIEFCYLVKCAVSILSSNRLTHYQTTK